MQGHAAAQGHFTMLETGQTIRKRSTKTVPALIAAVLAVCLAALAYVQWKKDSVRPPEQIILTDEARAYLPMLDLGEVEMAAHENALGQTLVEITGQISNLGDRYVRSIRINCVFFDIQGMEFHRVLSTIVRSSRGLAPSAQQSFRLPFDDIPEGWNQVMPNLYIAEIVFD